MRLLRTWFSTRVKFGLYGLNSLFKSKRFYDSMSHYSHPRTTLLTAHPLCPLPGAPHNQRTACLCVPPTGIQTFPNYTSSSSASHVRRVLCQSPATCPPPAAKPSGKWQSSPCPFYPWKTTEISPLYLVTVLNKIDGNIKCLEDFLPL